MPEHEVDFAELDDGTLVDMIEDPNNPENSLFAIYTNRTVQYAATVKREDRVLVPVPRARDVKARMPSSWDATVRLPCQTVRRNCSAYPCLC